MKNKNIKKLKSELDNFFPTGNKRNDARYVSEIRAELIDMHGEIPHDVNELNMDINQIVEDCQKLISLIEKKRG
jgi:hypothetical protein